MKTTADALNSISAAAGRIAAGQVTWGKTLGMLAARTLLFLFFQLVIAGIYLAAGSPGAFSESAAWWPVTAALAGLVCIGLLGWLARGEGLRLLDLYRNGPGKFPRDLWIALGLFALAGPIAWLPNVLTAQWLFGEPMIPVRMMFRPLPMWALFPAMLLFPVSIGLSELPVYMAYVQPRLAALTGRAWLAVLATGLALAAQHAALPLILDGRFIAYRALMFLPFALYVAVIARWRPGLMPYLMAGHALIDFSTMMVVLQAAQGNL